MMLNRMADHPSDSSASRNWPKYKVKFCNVPGIYIGFNLNGSSDSEGTKSLTSPLDIKTFSGVGITRSLLSSPKQQIVTIPIGSPHGFANPTSQTGMEHSESYTCVTSHGPKLSTKHIYNHCGTKCETVQFLFGNNMNMEHGMSRRKLGEIQMLQRFLLPIFSERAISANGN